MSENEPTRETMSLIDMLEAGDSTEETVTCTICNHTTVKSNERCPHCHRLLRMPTISDYGKKLPIGVFDGKKLLKEFDVQKLTYNVEWKVDEDWKRFIRANRGEGVTGFHYIMTVLANAVTNFVGKDFQKKFNFNQRLAMLRKAPIGDVIYMYAMVRLETLGNILELYDIECLHCRRKLDMFKADLSTLEISTIESVGEFFRVIALQDGFTFNGKENCKKIKIQPPTYMSLVDAPDNKVAAQTAQIKEAVIEIEDFGESSILTDEDFERMTRQDRIYLSREIDRHSGGPNWLVEINTCKCGKKFNILLPVFSHEDFFSDSFRYDRGRNF